MTSTTWKWLIVTAFVLSVTAIIFTAFRIRIVMTHDTWIGIMSSLVGAAATLIVGTQLYSSITTRKEIKSIQSLQAELREKLECSELKFEANHAFAEGIAFSRTQPFCSFISFLNAIPLYLKCKDYDTCQKAIENCDSEIQNIKSAKKSVNTYGCDDPIDEIIESIRKLPEYNLIQNQVDELLLKYSQLVEEVKNAQVKKPAKKDKTSDPQSLETPKSNNL